MAEQILIVAEKNPTQSFAVDALIWLVHQSAVNSSKAIELLAREHTKDKRIGGIAANLEYFPAPGSAKLLLLILSKNPDRTVQGQACISLARRLKTEAERAGSTDSTKEAEKYFDMAIQNFGDVSYGTRKVADEAKRLLLEIRILGIGKTAPEIVGEDIEGKQFKLSDYRGKVVLLDFWGDW